MKIRIFMYKYQFVDKDYRDNVDLTLFRQNIITACREILPMVRVNVQKNYYVIYGYVRKYDAVRIGRLMCRDKELREYCTEKGRLFRCFEKFEMTESELENICYILEEVEDDE